MLDSVVAVPEAVDSNTPTWRKHGASVDQILNNRIIIGLSNNELVIEHGCLLMVKTYGCHPGVVVDVFHPIGLGMVPMPEFITITNDFLRSFA